MNMKIFYYLSKHPRGRQWDTTKFHPKSIKPITPNVPYLGEGKHKVKRGHILSALAMKFPFSLNIKKLPKNIKVDGVYLFCGFLHDDLPYVTEIDNPSCLTYYSPYSIRNPVMQVILKSLAKRDNLIRFLPLSKAALTGLKNALGEIAEEKSTVLYPPFPYKIKHKKSNNVDVSFIFVTYHFWVKGGREVIKAAEKVKGNFKVTLISNVPKSIRIPKNVKIIRERIPREKLLKNIFPAHDVIVHPSYWDSFGMAPYEAVNIGLAAITTDLYALPEFAIHEKNGFNIHSPVEYFKTDYLPNPKLWEYEVVEKYVKNNTFPDVVKKLAEYMQYYIDNPKELRKHQRYSRKLAKEKFSLEKRNKILEKIFKEGIGCAE